MMNNTGFGLPLFFGVHMLAMLSISIGVILLLIWAFKHLSEKLLWKWGWILVGGGFVVCLLTLPLLGAMHGARFGDRPFGMMGGRWSSNEQTSSEKAAQLQEEADGKALYDQLQGKQVTCADLGDSDFELIGEYVMGQRLGDNHASMNDRIKSMMGDANEEQMHIFLGRSQTGCTDGSSGSLPGGMMPGGMMQRSSSAR